MTKVISLSYEIKVPGHKSVSDVLIINAGNNTDHVVLSSIVAMSRHKHDDGTSMLTITVPGSYICLGPFGKESNAVINNIIDHWLNHR